MDKYGIWDFEDVACANRNGYYPFDKPFTDCMLQTFKPTSVLDLGCGPGKYVAYIKTKGIPVEGYDGAFFEGVSQVNLAEPLSLPKHDLVLSLEVGEHIPKEFEATYISNLVATTGRVLVISWATVGQGGLGHVNEQPNEYVIKAIESVSSLKFSERETQTLRNHCTLAYFKRTLLSFVVRDKV